MAVIELKFEHSLYQTPIYLPIESLPESKSNDPSLNDTNRMKLDQTKIIGVEHPLIMVNNTYVNFEHLISFKLSNKFRIPELTLTIMNAHAQYTSVDETNIDNEIRVQILSPAEGKYKKIDLTFKIVNISASGLNITYKGEYKNPILNSYSLESYGEMSTYELFELAATEAGLGFASNVSSTNDKRYIIRKDESLLTLLNNEIKRSGGDGIYDFWIDYWNNLNLVDVRSLYGQEVQSDELTVWVSSETGSTSGEEGTETYAIEVPLLLQNIINLTSPELLIDKYEILSTSGNRYTDCAYFSFNADRNEYESIMEIDEDAATDIYIKRTYLGEFYGGYNYLQAEKFREYFFNKMDVNDNLSVVLKRPMFGIIRGTLVPVSIMYSDPIRDENIIQKMKYEGQDAQMFELSGVNKEGEDTIALDLNLTGCYYTSGLTIEFAKNKGWDYILKLSRPKSKKLNNQS